MAHPTPSPEPSDDVKARLLHDAGDDDLELEELGKEERTSMQEELGLEPAWRRQRKARRCATTAQFFKSWRTVLPLAIGLATLTAILIYIHVPAIRQVSAVNHAIDNLITEADAAFKTLTAEGNYATLEKAAAAYRIRRGRHPPPLFDKWFEWAREKNCTHYEFMFDQIYEDVEPFWGTDAAKVRADAASWPVIFTIRGGIVTRRSEVAAQWASRDWLWEQMISEIPSEHLPDVDLPLNCDDKAHIFTPWEEINGYIQNAVKTKRIRPADEMSQRYSSYPPAPPADFYTFNDYPSEENLWLLARDTCPPDSPARQLIQDPDLTTPSRFPSKAGRYMRSGFVANWTASKSPCEAPDIRNLHGLFINSHPGSHQYWHQPNSEDRQVTRQFFPLFSSGKVQGSNNDIIIPPATSWTEDYFSADKTIWAEKRNEVFWRGSATGGQNNATNWTRFHRHRLASMSNGTQVAMQERSPIPPAHVPGNEPPLPYNVALPDHEIYPLAAVLGEEESDLGRWISSWGDVSFTHLFCHRVGKDFENWISPKCPYDSHWYFASEENKVPMESMYQHKYLPDVDGHGYSGRYRSFMDSDSVPFKATIWAEWSHSRLFAWKHFVPMDNTFMDLYGLVEYFVGYQPPEGSSREAREGHDAEAKAIADAGREWAQKVLRKEDMVLYLWRVVLEYARAVDDRREDIGYVDDLLRAA